MESLLCASLDLATMSALGDFTLLDASDIVWD